MLTAPGRRPPHAEHHAEHLAERHAGAGHLDPPALTLLTLIAQGLPVDRVARELGCSERTVRRRTRAVCDRLGVGTPVEAVAWAARRRLL